VVGWSPKKFALLASSAGLSIALAMGSWSVAKACGMFRGIRVAPEQMPTLSREKVLIIHDAAKGEEHFIREVAFERAGERLGFVVPTPTRPTVAAVDKTPFTNLRKAFPFFAPFAVDGIGRGGGYGRGSGAGFGGGGVTVLEQTKVGSFETYVLAATDEADLAKWLADNGLVASTGAEAWLKHYVQMGFYYVAMRYDPPKRGRKAKDAKAPPVTAETIRISFATPMPYYPYLEPVEPKLKGESPRLLEVWYAGVEAVVPVSLHGAGAQQAWVRPLKPGEEYADGRDKVEGAIAADLHGLLPAGPLVVQTFQDQKRSREGLGDVLFVPKEPQRLDAAQVAKLQPLLGILDPALAPKPAEVAKDVAP